MVVDTSVLLSIFFNEKSAKWAAEKLEEFRGTLCMSTVNLTEVLIHIKDRQPKLADDLEQKLLHSGIRFVAPDCVQAKIAAEARLKFPINLGDCFAYALATAEDCPILTLDKDFRVTDLKLVLPK